MKAKRYTEEQILAVPLERGPHKAQGVIPGV
jgi:hypothetical protein